MRCRYLFIHTTNFPVSNFQPPEDLMVLQIVHIEEIVCELARDGMVRPKIKKINPVNF